MIPKRILLFAPAAFNLAETTRMIEIAKGSRCPRYRKQDI